MKIYGHIQPFTRDSGCCARTLQAKQLELIDMFALSSPQKAKAVSSDDNAAATPAAEQGQLTLGKVSTDGDDNDNDAYIQCTDNKMCHDNNIMVHTGTRSEESCRSCQAATSTTERRPSFPTLQDFWQSITTLRAKSHPLYAQTASSHGGKL